MTPVAEVEKAVRAAAKGIAKEKAAERAFFMKVAMPLHGLTVPVQRKLAMQGYSFSDKPPSELAKVWTDIWRGAESHEAKVQATLTLEQFAGDLDFDQRWALVQDWCGSINCWDQSDMLSGHVASALEEKPKLVWPVLEDWNEDADPWKRRQSLVGLFFYSRFRETYPPATRVLKLVTNLLDDPDYYVQKGVGWTLRETYNAFPDKAYAYLLKQAARIHPDAFSASVEKVTAAEKEAIKERRKARPRKKR